MALVLKDRVSEFTSTTGTSSLILTGAAVGYTSFDVIGTGSTTYYTVTNGTDWEVGIGTYTSATKTLTRDTVLSSSTGSKIAFGSGTKSVFITYPAQKAVVYDTSDNVGVGTTQPSAKLHIVGTSNSYNSPQLRLGEGGSNLSTAKQLLIGYNTTDNAGYIQAYQWNSGATPLIIQSSGGNVGIGTSVPTTKLDVAGGVKLGSAGTDTIVLTGQVSANTSVGTAGQVLTSRGPNLSPQWLTPSSGTGTVTSFSFTNANGFTGTVLNSATAPALTLGTSLTGMLRGNGTALVAATAGTDYQIPISLTTTGTSGGASFNPATGALNIPVYSSNPGGGTVTSVSVVSANGLGGTVANASSTPAITLTTSIGTSGTPAILKGNGTAISAATAGTDYLAPPAGTSILKANSGGALANATAGIDYQAPISLTTTGSSGPATIVGSTLNIPNYAVTGGTVTAVSVVSANGLSGTSSGGTTPALTLGTTLTGMLRGNGTALVAATAGTDYQIPISLTVTGTSGAATFNPATGALNIPQYTGSGSGTVTSFSFTNANGFTGTVNNPATIPALTLGTSLTGMLRGNGTALVAATAGTDYLAPPSGTSILKANSGGALANATVNIDYQGPITVTNTGTSGAATLVGNTLNIPVYSSNPGGGTVTSVGVVSANGFAGTVANASSTPAITLTTSITGMLRGNGTALVAATAGTDYLAPPSGTSILKANSGGALANATAGVDYQLPISLTTTGTSGPATIVGSTLNIPNYAVGGGTVTAVSVASANGFSGTSSGGATPALTLGTTVGTAGTPAILKGNGTAISAATAGTDYLAPPAGTSLLKANSGGALANATAGVDYQLPISLTTTGSSGPATIVGSTLNIPNYVPTAGTVTTAAPITAGYIPKMNSTSAITNSVLAESTSRIGLGTTSPAYDMDVRGSARSYSSIISGLAVPAAPVGTGSATGGTLAAATYYFKIVAVDLYGNTSGASAESTGVTTTGTTSSISVAFTTVQGATGGYQIWFTTTSGTYTAGYFSTTAASPYVFTTTTGATAPPTLGIPLQTSDSSYLSSAPGTGTLFFTTGNTERMRITSSGNVGIGTFPTNDSPGNYGMLTCYRSTGNTYIEAVNKNATGVAGMECVSQSLTLTSVSDFGNFVTYIRNGSNAPLTLGTYALERIRINGGGLVGIGTTAPSYTLDVNGGERNYGLIVSTASDPAAAPTTVVSATGGTLAAATYYFKIVGVDAVGALTAPSAESTGAVTTGTTSSIAVTWNKVTGVNAYRLYFTTTSGNYTAGTYFAVAIDSVANRALGTTATFTFTSTTSGVSTGTISTANSTGSAQVNGNLSGPAGSTTMTNGFFYIPAAAGAPTGTPTAITGRVPMYYDTTNNNFYVYNGAWKKVLLA